MRLIVVGTLPVVVVGLLFGDLVGGDALRTPAVVAVTLALGAVGLLVAERLGTQTRSEDSVGYGEALAIGIAQAAALVPGHLAIGGDADAGAAARAEASGCGAIRLSPEPAGGAGRGGEGDPGRGGSRRRGVAGDAVCRRAGGVGGRRAT